MSFRQWLLLLATATSFASSAVMNKFLIAQLPPITLAAMRVLFAAPVAFAMLNLLERELPQRRADWGTTVLAGFGAIIVPYTALAIGQQTIASGMSAILYSTMPLYTLLIAHFILHDEPLGPRKLLGVALGLAGVTAVIGPSLLSGIGDHLVAEMITLCGPIAYAMAVVAMRRSHHIDAIAMTAGMFLIATFVLLPIALLIEQPWGIRTGWDTVAWLFALAVIGSITPALLNYLLVQQVGATRASIGTFLVPVIAVFLGAIFLGERLHASALLGLLMIIAGSMAINGIGLNRLRNLTDTPASRAA